MQVQPNATCPQCGNLFFCNVHDINNCACATIKLTHEQLQLAKNTFTTCVCVNCLNKFVELKTSNDETL